MARSVTRLQSCPKSAPAGVASRGIVVRPFPSCTRKCRFDVAENPVQQVADAGGLLALQGGPALFDSFDGGVEAVERQIHEEPELHHGAVGALVRAQARDCTIHATLRMSDKARSRKPPRAASNSSG